MKTVVVVIPFFNNLMLFESNGIKNNLFFLSCRPFWLSPRQCILITVSANYDDYAKDVSFTYYFLKNSHNIK